MRRSITYMILAGWLTTIHLQAQTSLLGDRLRDTFSPSEKRYDTQSMDMETRKLRQTYANPAFYDIARSDSSFQTGRYRSMISASYSNGCVEGDFLPYEGNAFTDFRLTGFGQYSIPSAGTLFGKVQYARGRHKNIGWNAMRHPELYLPYIATDSIGGDFHFEDYHVEGGYAFSLGNWHLGATGFFRGEQAYRKTDPRALNNTTWLNVGIGAARSFGGHLLMLNGSFGRNKQHMSLRFWRPGEQQRFFICYGFGLYDHRASSIRFGYSRMYYIKEGSARLTYQSPSHQHPFVVYASIGYEYDRMKAEESNVQDLYFSRTNTFSPTLRLDWQPGGAWDVSFLLESRLDRRKGYENIFEEYLIDEANNIYDFRLIDTQQKYLYSYSESMAQLRLRYRPLPGQVLSLQTGASYFLRKEEYRGTDYRVKNSAILPQARIGYLLEKKRSEWEWNVQYGKRIGTGNTYQVVMQNQSIPHLDFQHTFAPYAYYDCDYSSLLIAATYVCRFKRFGIGVNLKLMYTFGERDKEAVYAGQVGFASSAPMIASSPARHDEWWGSSSLFFVF